MNVLLWVVQVVLAVLSLAGGAYKVLMFEQLAKLPPTGAMPRAGWVAAGVFEVLCGVLLLLPAVAKRMRALTPLVAGALVVESVAFAVLYARYSLELTATNPLVWVVVMAVMAAFVAFGRYSVRRSA
ncbi:MAG TPA: hypothetical protein VGJ81_09230 [Thermoanaerobaculia bacterium]|jgi:uncharacterized membrane protein